MELAQLGIMAYCLGIIYLINVFITVSGSFIISTARISNTAALCKNAAGKELIKHSQEIIDSCNKLYQKTQSHALRVYIYVIFSVAYITILLLAITNNMIDPKPFLISLSIGHCIFTVVNLISQGILDKKINIVSDIINKLYTVILESFQKFLKTIEPEEPTDEIETRQDSTQ